MHVCVYTWTHQFWVFWFWFFFVQKHNFSYCWSLWCRPEKQAVPKILRQNFPRTISITRICLCFFPYWDCVWFGDSLVSEASMQWGPQLVWYLHKILSASMCVHFSVLRPIEYHHSSFWTTLEMKNPSAMREYLLGCTELSVQTVSLNLVNDQPKS